MPVSFTAGKCVCNDSLLTLADSECRHESDIICTEASKPFKYSPGGQRRRLAYARRTGHKCALMGEGPGRGRPGANHGRAGPAGG